MTDTQHLNLVIIRIRFDPRAPICAVAPSGKAALIQVKGSPVMHIRGSVESVAVRLCGALGVDA